MNKSILHLITKYVSVSCACLISFTNLSLTALALTEDEKEAFKKEIVAASELLQDAIDKSKEESLTKFKKMVAEKGYDYQLSLMSYENQTDPYSGLDYNELIFSYTTAKEHSKMTDTLYNLPFMEIESTEKTVSQYIPKEVQMYTERDDGYYDLGKKVLIDEPTTIITVKKVTGHNKYEKTGEKKIVPERKETTYAEVTVKGLSGIKILEHFGLSDDIDILNEYKKKLVQAENIISGVGLSQVYNIKVPSFISIDQGIEDYLSELLSSESIDYGRKVLISVAKALIGKVPYEWGGKSEKSGYDSTWWTLKETGQQKGLDCSGYVQWAFRTAGFDEWPELTSTQEILKITQTISEEELKPGDLGLLNNGQSINHVGIYLGNGYWIHCSSGKGTVVAEKTSMFSIFKRMPGDSDVINEEVSAEFFEEEEPVQETEFFVAEKVEEIINSEIYLLAQLINHEAHTEGLNGWIAVAEVVLNRVKSNSFPDSIREVIYQSGQFAYSDEIKDITPTDEEIQVALNVYNGQLEILGNENVLFFRNAKGSKNDWGNYKWFTEINHHEFYLGA